MKVNVKTDYIKKLQTEIETNNKKIYDEFVEIARLIDESIEIYDAPSSKKMRERAQEEFNKYFEYINSKNEYFNEVLKIIASKYENTIYEIESVVGKNDG